MATNGSLRWDPGELNSTLLFSLMHAATATDTY